MSTILGQTPTATAPDSAYSATGTPDAAPPAGFNVKVTGLITRGNNPGTVGMVFEVDTPAGYSLDQKSSGSENDPSEGSGYNKMLFTTTKDGGSGGTFGWEIWFAEKDVDGDGWELPVELVVDGTRYTYKFRKGGSGGGHRR